MVPDIHTDIQYLLDKLEQSGKKYDTEIGFLSAEEIKHSIGCASAREKVLYSHVKGKGLSTDLPKDNIISSEDIEEAIKDEALKIVNTIVTVLSDASASSIGQIAIDGIHLSGGGALLYGINELIKKQCNIEVKIDANAESGVVSGATEAIKLWNNNKNLDLFDTY